MIRFVIEFLVIAAVIAAMCFDEKIAKAEKKIFESVKISLGIGKNERMEQRLREERFAKQQMLRELELLELGCEPETKTVTISVGRAA